MSHPAPSAPRNDADRSATIFRQAAQIFHDKGFHATSMSEIADAAALTKAGLYYYVKGKEDLLFGIVSFAMDRLEGWIEEASELEDAAERLEHIVRCHVGAITTDGAAVTLLVDESEGLSEEHRAEIRARQRRYLDFMRGLLTELRRQGRLATVDATVASFALVGMIVWIARWYDPAGKLSADRITDEITAIALRSVLEPA